MTVSSEISQVSYDTDGVTTAFPVPFYFLANDHLRVWLFYEDTGVEVDLVLGSSFLVTGAGNPAGGTVTTSTAYPVGPKLRIERVVPITQETAYQRNDPFPERAHERALDKLTMICQQLAGFFGLLPGSTLRALLLGRNDVDGQGAYRARNNRIQDLADPKADQDAVNRRSMFAFVTDYVDRAIAGVVGGFGWFLQWGIGSIYRTFQDKMRDSVSVRDFIDTPIDGVTSNQAGIEAAVAAALAKGADLEWPPGPNYVSTANIPGFHQVRHRGRGVIKRGESLFSVEPQGQTESVLYVAPGAPSTNDGLDPFEPTTIAAAFVAMNTLGSRASAGVWAIQFLAGVFTDSGITFYSPPHFSNGLRIRGTFSGGSWQSVWDGSASPLAYGIRMDRREVSTSIVISDMHFRNWDNGTANSGAVVCWDGINYASQNCKFESCSIGEWVRGGFSTHYGNQYVSCRTWGVCAQYSHTATIGNVGLPCLMSNCGASVFIARQSTGHVDYTSFSGNRVDIQLHQKSRVGCVGGSHATWTDVAVWLQGDSIYEADTNTPPSYDAASITDATPIFRFDNGSSVPAVHAGSLSYRTQHSFPSSPYTLTGTTSEVAITSQPGYQAALRYPKNMFYTGGNLVIKISMLVQISGASAKTIRLCGPGPTLELVNISVPPNGGSGQIDFALFFRPDGTCFITTKMEMTNTALNQTKLTFVGSTAISAIRDKSGDLSIWRVYASLTDAANSIIFYGWSTEVSG